MSFKHRVWDLPTRSFHWALALSVVGLFISGNVGGNAMLWHMRLGYFVASLLLFRVVWGFVCGYWSRFAQLRLAPQALLVYLRGQSGQKPHDHLGHSPTGSWSVVALLSLLFAKSLQVCSVMTIFLPLGRLPHMPQVIWCLAPRSITLGLASWLSFCSWSRMLRPFGFTPRRSATSCLLWFMAIMRV